MKKSHMRACDFQSVKKLGPRGLLPHVKTGISLQPWNLFWCCGGFAFFTIENFCLTLTGWQSLWSVICLAQRVAKHLHHYYIWKSFSSFYPRISSHFPHILMVDDMNCMRQIEGKLWGSNMIKVWVKSVWEIHSSTILFQSSLIGTYRIPMTRSNHSDDLIFSLNLYMIMTKRLNQHIPLPTLSQEA